MLEKFNEYILAKHKNKIDEVIFMTELREFR